MNLPIPYLKILVTMLLLSSVVTVAQSGGGFVIQQSVIPAGGGNASGGSFAVEVSNAQSTAHSGISGTPFTITAGFWNPLFAPTAAGVSVSGRVTNAEGAGVVNSTVVCVDATGNLRRTRTNGFGYYQFFDITVGQTYFFYIESKSYSFETRVINVAEELTDLDFVAINK